MSIQTEGWVRSTVTEGVARIRFYHPAQNSLPSNLLLALKNAIDTAGQDPDVAVVVLESEGDRTFCAGASFDELASIEDSTTGHQFFMGFANVINACRRCPKFVLGRVHGKAVGGGVGLASAVDYCMATQFALVRLSELAVGIGAFVIGPAVQRKMGVSAFTELSINAGEWRTAAWASQKGLFCEVFDTTEQLDAYIDQLCDKIKGYNPAAISKLKAVFWEGTEDWDQLLSDRAAISGELVLSEFSKETIARVRSKD
jgi:methylglutaconyl-CoA hydratase